MAILHESIREVEYDRLALSTYPWKDRRNEGQPMGSSRARGLALPDPSPFSVLTEVNRKTLSKLHLARGWKQIVSSLLVALFVPILNFVPLVSISGCMCFTGAP